MLVTRGIGMPRMWCAGLFAKRRGRYEPFGANPQIACMAVNWPLSSYLRRGALAGPSIPAATTTTKKEVEIEDTKFL